MAVAIFFGFSGLVLIAGMIMTVLVVRHHWFSEKKEQN